MYVKEVSYGLFPRINTGNYQSIGPSGGAVVSLNEGESIDDAINLARKIALQSFVVSSDDQLNILNVADKHNENFPAVIVRDLIAKITIKTGG
jgi:hypothetical protein